MRKTRGCTRVACASIALVATFWAACFGISQAQSNTLDVTGTVTANDGTPVAGATVVLSGQRESLSARSDAHGILVIRNVRAGTYALHAGAPGYQAISQRTVTVDSANSTLAIVLSPATTSSLTVIGQVRASAGETVSTSSEPSVSLSAQSAAAAGATSVASMVWPLLSVTPVIPLGGGSNATVSFAVRGPDPTETLVDIDGHQQNNGNTGDFDLSLLDPAALQEVQVLNGISPSSLIGPNMIGGGINILTLQPTNTPQGLIRIFGGNYGTFGETIQATGIDDRFGYAVSLHGTTADGSVNQTVLAPPGGGAPPTNDETLQSVGSGSYGDSLLTKLRYQLGGPNGYGYIQLDFRNANISKDDSALLTNYTPPGPVVGGGCVSGAVPTPCGGNEAISQEAGGYQSFAGTLLGEHQSNYGFDAQIPLGNQLIDAAPATLFQYSHLTSVWTQSVSGPGADTLQYLYNQRDLLGDDWLEVDHHFTTGTLSFKYDLNNETLTTNYVQGQVIAETQPIGPPVTYAGDSVSTDATTPDGPPPVQTLPLSQTQRYAVLRYNGDPTSHIHYSIAGYDSWFSTFGHSFDPRAGFV